MTQSSFVDGVVDTKNRKWRSFKICFGSGSFWHMLIFFCGATLNQIIPYEYLCKQFFWWARTSSSKQSQILVAMYIGLASPRINTFYSADIFDMPFYLKFSFNFVQRNFNSFGFPFKVYGMTTSLDNIDSSGL